MKKIINRSEKGITLIALVITIIVLLILAGVAISMLAGDNGILRQAANAKNESEKQALIEQIKLGAISALTKGLGTIESEDDLKTALVQQGLKDAKVTGDVTTGYIVTVEDTIYKISSSGLVSEANELDMLKQIRAGEYAAETSKYIDSNNDVAIIPKGFTVSGLTDENVIKDGLVIYEGDLSTQGENIVNYQSTNNQFVWIPVSDPKVMYGTMSFEDSEGIIYANELIQGEQNYGNYYGKLYNYNSDGTLTHLNWWEEITEEYAKEVILERNGCSTWEEYLEYYDQEYNTMYQDAVTSWNSMDEEQSKTFETMGITTPEQYTKWMLFLFSHLSDNIEYVKYAVYDCDYHDNTSNTYFNEMVQSVEKYNGFYIGRYETSGSGTDWKTVNNYTNVIYRKEYKQDSNIGGVIGMIWDCQFDQTLIFVNNNGNISEKEKNIYSLADKNKEVTNSSNGQWNIMGDGGTNVYRHGWNRATFRSGDGIESGRLQLYIK